MKKLLLLLIVSIPLISWAAYTPMEGYTEEITMAETDTPSPESEEIEWCPDGQLAIDGQCAYLPPSEPMGL